MAHMLAKDYSAADQDFARGLEHAVNPAETARLFNSRMRARARLGKALETFGEADDKAMAYRVLGPILIDQNQADDLAALVKAYRAIAPKEPTLGLWEAESRWMAKSYEQVVAILSRERNAILSDPERMAQFEDRLIRSLVRLKKYPEAATAAKESTERDGDPWFEAIVAAASGDVPGASELLGKCADRGYTRADFDADPDLAPALAAPAFSAARKARCSEISRSQYKKPRRANASTLKKRRRR